MVLVSVPCDGAAPSRCGALDIVPLDARLYVGGGCPSLLAHRAVTQMVVYGRGCNCVGSACSYDIWRRVHVMVLLVSRRLLLITAAVNVCLSVGRCWPFKRAVHVHPRKLMYAACRLAVVTPTRTIQTSVSC
jgi:hypothetical protein